MMEEMIQLNRKDYDSMYQSTMELLNRKRKCGKTLYVAMTREEIAEWSALTYCMKLNALLKDNAA